MIIKLCLSFTISLSLSIHTEPVRLIKNLIKLESDAGTDPGYLRDLSVKINILIGNNGFLADKVRIFATHLASAVSPSPLIPVSPVSWSVKNTIFAAQTFMLSAQANGLNTAPMEGYDERRLCYALNIPMSKYSVPLVISTGYAMKGIEGEKVYKGDQIGKRYPLEDICFTDKYENGYKSVLSDSINSEKSAE